MGLSANGISHPNGNGTPPKQTSDSPRCPRRVVLLNGDEAGEVQQVLAEFHGGQVSGKVLHAELQRLAAEHPGHYVAAEWLGVLGWTRFLWCRK